MKRSFYSSLILLSISFFLILSSCKKDEGPTAPQNHAPKIGSLVANPTTILVNFETSLTCVATDEDGDNLTITWSSKRGAFTNGSVGVSVKWTAPTTAGKDTITVTVNDSKQTTQGKLEIIVGTISTSPTLLTPSDNANEIALSPTVNWNASNSAVSYTLQVSTNNVFTSYVYDQYGLTNTTQQISGLNSNTTYFWRVNSSNIYGTSSWSNVFSFKTVAPPQAPILLTPINNATEVALSPTLTWTALSNATSYTLQASTNNSFSSFVYNQSGLTNTNQIISGLNIWTTYYWRVNATNIYGTSSWSNVWSFTTQSSLVGTWVLTKITVISGGASIEMTPAQAQVESTIIAKADGTYTLTVKSQGVTSTENGTWSTDGKKVTFKMQDGTVRVSDYTLTGKLVVSQTIPTPLGAEIPANLEFTKQ